MRKFSNLKFWQRYAFIFMVLLFICFFKTRSITKYSFNHSIRPTFPTLIAVSWLRFMKPFAHFSLQLKCIQTQRICYCTNLTDLFQNQSSPVCQIQLQIVWIVIFLKPKPHRFGKPVRFGRLIFGLAFHHFLSQIRKSPIFSGKLESLYYLLSD